MTLADRRFLAFSYLGDLHLPDARQKNYKDMSSIVAQIEAECARRLDFVVLPGDNVDNGKPEQYALAAIALRILSLPVHAIPGDHDMEQGSLAAFHAASIGAWPENGILGTQLGPNRNGRKW